MRSAELAVQCARRALLARSGAYPDLNAYAVAWRREFLPKWRLCTLLQHAIRRPSLAECLVARLSRRADLTRLLMAAVGDLLPARNLRFLPLLSQLLMKDGTRA